MPNGLAHGNKNERIGRIKMPEKRLHVDILDCTIKRYESPIGPGMHLTDSQVNPVCVATTVSIGDIKSDHTSAESSENTKTA